MNAHRLRTPFLIIYLLLLALAVRLFHIQVICAGSYSVLAQKQSVKKVKSQSYRGDIYDRNGHLLATTIESKSLYIHPKEIRKPKEFVRFLHSEFALNSKDMSEKMDSGVNFLWIKRKLQPVLAEKIIEMKIDGMGVDAEQKRYYPNGSMACHLIGCVGLENRGLSGIEQSLNSFLEGKSFVQDQLQDRRGRSIMTNVVKKNSSGPNSIHLTIDRSLQYLAEKEIQRGVEENEACSGMIVIQNPKNGEILAMASYPSFNPNTLSDGNFPSSFNNAMLLNPVVSKMFEPGSTFKIVTFSAALEERKFTTQDTLFCENGKWEIADRVIKDHEPSALITFSEVLERSSNIGSAKIGLKIGKERFYRYLRSFGFGAKTWISLPGETEGKCRNPKDRQWTSMSLPAYSFGQELGVTAIQLVNAFSAIANGGLLMEPVIIKQLNDFKMDKTVTTSFSSQVVRRVISTDTSRIMREILYRAVERGTGQRAKVSGYSVAGKTGTAQKFDTVSKKYFLDKHLSSFCGFLPVEDPQLVCLVILDEPRKNYWGGYSAAPIFSRVMSRAVQIMGILSNSPPLAALIYSNALH